MCPAARRSRWPWSAPRAWVRIVRLDECCHAASPRHRLTQCAGKTEFMTHVQKKLYPKVRCPSEICAEVLIDCRCRRMYAGSRQIRRTGPSRWSSMNLYRSASPRSRVRVPSAFAALMHDASDADQPTTFVFETADVCILCFSVVDERTYQAVLDKARSPASRRARVTVSCTVDPCRESEPRPAHCTRWYTSRPPARWQEEA